MSKLAKALTASAGNAGEAKAYVEDVFSTLLYTGTNTNPTTLTNGIDLAGEGGLIWTKLRNTTETHALIDTARGSGNAWPYLASENTNTEGGPGGILSFTSTGYTVSAQTTFNGLASNEYVSWTFRKAKKFFDIVTYTGDGASSKTLSHNLGSVPGMMIVKNRLVNGGNWLTYHISLGNTKFLTLNTQNAANTATTAWNDTTPTDAVFTVGSSSDANTNGNSYVAYLFASDAGGYGDDGTESIVKCGAFTIPASGAVSINLGWEPQFVLIKLDQPSGGAWTLLDTKRQYNHQIGARISPDANTVEEFYTNAGGGPGYPTATGFDVLPGLLDANYTAVYIAIRMGPMKTPDDATKVFAVDQGDNAGSATVMAYTAGFPVDAAFHTRTEANQNRFWSGRLVGAKYLLSESNAAAVANTAWTFDSNTQYFNDYATTTSYAYMFQRAPGFMDVVCYSGTNGTISRNHNLTVAPELMIFKRRNSTSAWTVLSELDGSSYSEMGLNSTIDKSTRNYSANQYLTAQPTATVFAQAAGYDNVSGGTYIAYLFATLAGVSKVGSYTGNAGYAVNVDCGFSAGAKFILIKRTNSSGDWYVYDTVRGIGSGNDPYFFLNDTAAQVTNTNYIASLSSGFTVTASAPAGLNASGGTYIFLAIA